MELLQAMRVFAQVAQLGSFTKAADALQTGRPHVTRTIQELETSLGVRLFQRTTRQVRLTAEGERFNDRVQEILGSIAQATAMFDASGASLRGRLRVDIPTALSQPAFIDSLHGFCEQYPDIDLTLGVTDRAVDLVAEGVDCVLRIGELPDSSLVARRIGTATMVTCAAPAYLRSFGTPQTPDDLDAHRGVRFLSGQNNRPLAWQFLQDGVECGYLCREGILVNESAAYVACGVAGFGILQAPGIVLDRYLASGELVEILADYRPAARAISLLYPSRTHLAPQVQVFVDWVSQRFATVFAAWLE